MKLKWDEDAWDDYLYWQTQDKKTLKRINKLIKDIMRNAFEGIGKPEKLTDSPDYWSRRIDDVNRVVYKIEDNTVVIASVRGHYDD